MHPAATKAQQELDRFIEGNLVDVRTQIGYLCVHADTIQPFTDELLARVVEDHVKAAIKTEITHFSNQEGSQLLSTAIDEPKLYLFETNKTHAQQREILQGVTLSILPPCNRTVYIPWGQIISGIILQTIQSVIGHFAVKVA